jgi:hypothetical protein
VTTANTFTVNTAASITQAAPADALKILNGILSIITGSANSLGAIGNPLVVRAQTLQLSTQGNAFISVLGATAMGDSTVLGNLTLTSNKSFTSTGLLQVEGIAQITANGNIGSPGDSPFLIAGTSFGGTSSELLLASFTANSSGSINVQVNGSIELKNATAGGAVILTTEQSGSITVDGAIRRFFQMLCSGIARRRLLA